jgi:hypothetical protein
MSYLKKKHRKNAMVLLICLLELKKNHEIKIKCILNGTLLKYQVCDILENIFLNIKTETYQIDPQQS